MGGGNGGSREEDGEGREGAGESGETLNLQILNFLVLTYQTM